ncbi:MAG TPA: 2-amino-4-hydroxy-6-hydroxymethyldihydropteridine diphosphokinase [Candidatus Methylacidiphilales bacterium]|jgi:2-amino-4-hydroxy-6-hydroxymethyldihydropteridine diphosphokinase|nr:2-amino-4-hydroxy-6-hydroxymethyldihydropteridine diphosphokinase [Candidatus Methylacidiphilales bacterium]
MPDVLAGIALGSNLGDRSAELDAGISFLRYLSTNDEVRESPRIETAPVDCPPGSPPFLNSVAEIEIDSVLLPPLNFFSCLEEFEIERGRSPLRDVNTPRPLDLDIIYYGVERFGQMGLIIPHPRAHLRRFVLEPLSHLRPELILPGQTKTVAELLADIR